MKKISLIVISILGLTMIDNEVSIERVVVELPPVYSPILDSELPPVYTISNKANLSWFDSYLLISDVFVPTPLGVGILNKYTKFAFHIIEIIIRIKG